MKANPRKIVTRSVVPDDGLDNSTILELSEYHQEKVLDTRRRNSERTNRANNFRAVLKTIVWAVIALFAAWRVDMPHLAQIFKGILTRAP